jgi:uncharacterized protein (TIGR03083 family)
MNERDVFAEAAAAFAALAGRIQPGQWDQPGLGDWDIRSLTGHTSRSLTTVLSYLDQPAERAAIATPEQYYAWTRPAAASLGAGAVAERGRQAGRELGADPAASVRRLAAEAVRRVRSTAGDPVITTLGGGMRLSDYLPTRTFELAVHGLDLAAAAGLPAGLPPAVLRAAADLAARIAVVLGDGPLLLRALTGRAALPAGYSVV